MTSAVTSAVPGIGDIVYLCSAAIQLGVSAITTPPDVPNQYTAEMKVMGDGGDINLDAIAGKQGPAGQAMFALREATKLGHDPIDNPASLPTLTNTRQDIGLYWLIDEVDAHGHVLAEWCYIWWGSYYRQIMMGVVGAPGPTPRVSPIITQIPPDKKSYVKPTGSSLAPTWDFMVASPAGVPGPVAPFYGFPDVDEVSVAPVAQNVLAFGADGSWAPFDVGHLIPATYSMPQSGFTSYSGVSQQAAIGSFVIPPQPFAWTPIVWGHIGGVGVNLSANPLMIGCQVLLGDPVTGKQVARGLGNTLGTVNIMPHYSSAGATAAAITPGTKALNVPANHTDPAVGTLYINLWNDGQLGFYAFTPANAQLFVMVVPR